MGHVTRLQDHVLRITLSFGLDCLFPRVSNDYCMQIIVKEAGSNLSTRNKNMHKLRSLMCAVYISHGYHAFYIYQQYSRPIRLTFAIRDSTKSIPFFQPCYVHSLERTKDQTDIKVYITSLLRWLLTTTFLMQFTGN